jgi:glucosamine--fructose-6-phosphate aminotransferase (isomerizing)
VFAIGTQGDQALAEMSEYFLGLPPCAEHLEPLLATVLLHLLAYHTALALGHDVDQPRNLAKSVTVE